MAGRRHLPPHLHRGRVAPGADAEPAADVEPDLDHPKHGAGHREERADSSSVDKLLKPP